MIGLLVLDTISLCAKRRRETIRSEKVCLALCVGGYAQ